MEQQIGQLVAADEQFCHQVTETFANVGSSDPSWTEKVCAMAAAKDGSLQLGFGLGKYVNRNVIDAYANGFTFDSAVSVGRGGSVLQW